MGMRPEVPLPTNYESETTCFSVVLDAMALLAIMSIAVNLESRAKNVPGGKGNIVEADDHVLLMTMKNNRESMAALAKTAASAKGGNVGDATGHHKKHARKGILRIESSKKLKSPTKTLNEVYMCTYLRVCTNNMNPMFHHV